jgi:hypothetical protein
MGEGEGCEYHCSVLFVSALRGAKVVFPVKPQFVLNTFSSFLRCYMFLCKVAEYVGNEVERVFKEWETEEGRLKFQERSRDTRARSPWRHATSPELMTRDSSCLGSSGSSAQDAMELEMEECESGQNEPQLLDGGDRLVRQNLRILDAQSEGNSEGMLIPPVNDITGWAQRLAESRE